MLGAEYTAGAAVDEALLMRMGFDTELKTEDGDFALPREDIDCSSERILICDLNKACGFGCQMHHLANCVQHALGILLVYYCFSY